MFYSETCLPHILAPSSYSCPLAYQVEVQRILRDSWHVVGTLSELSQPGDFITTFIADVPVHIRNFEGRISALSNVCAHRHATICSRSSGRSPSMQCEYHGWQYQEDGSTGKIPQPKNFVPFERQRLRLPQYHVAEVGQLVFVSVAGSPVPIEEFLGAEMHSLLTSRFDFQWRLAWKWQPQFSVNWKIPIENSLESYHVPNVHSQTFREDPGPERSQHVLLDRRTAMSTPLPFSPHSRLDRTFQRLETRFVRWLGRRPTSLYWQHHVFPNLLFSFTDAISLVNCILPTSPKTCAAVVRQFGIRELSSNSWQSPMKRLVAIGWGKLTAALTRRILLEDQTIFPSIQAGLDRSPHQGVLGACEERIHRFQQFVDQATR